jgi:hypothetical protein
MSKRWRVLTFGGAGLLVAVGVGQGVVIGGDAGEVAAIVLVGLGLVAAVSLVFYEVGLSEDHERDRLAAQARRASSTPEGPRDGRRPREGRRMRPVARLDRMRGHQRRLR